jgi:hypothetical protein
VFWFVGNPLEKFIMPALCELPDFLCHDYEWGNGPFRSHSNLSLLDAKAVLVRIHSARVQFPAGNTIQNAMIRLSLNFCLMRCPTEEM